MLYEVITLDIITESDQGEITSFCTISYDPGTQSAVCVLVGTAFEHQQKGLAKAAMIEGFHRLKNLGATRVFATAHIPAADALYGSVMDTYNRITSYNVCYTKLLRCKSHNVSGYL